MADPLPLPPLPESTKPPLTPGMLQAAKDTSTPPPGAGGWTPRPSTMAALGFTAVVLTPLSMSLPHLLPGRLGLTLGAVCGAIVGGCIWLAGRSAGPRIFTP